MGSCASKQDSLSIDRPSTIPTAEKPFGRTTSSNTTLPESTAEHTLPSTDQPLTPEPEPLVAPSPTYPIHAASTTSIASERTITAPKPEPIIRGGTLSSSTRSRGAYIRSRDVGPGTLSVVSTSDSDSGALLAGTCAVASSGVGDSCLGSGEVTGTAKGSGTAETGTCCASGGGSGSGGYSSGYGGYSGYSGGNYSGGTSSSSYGSSSGSTSYDSSSSSTSYSSTSDSSSSSYC